MADHKLVTKDENNAECSCGGWWWLIVDKSMPPEQKEKSIAAGFNRHLKRVL